MMGVRLVGRVFFLFCALQWSIGQLELASYSLDVPPNSGSNTVGVNRENGEVFIAAGNQLLRLSRSLDLLETANVSGGDLLVRIALGSRLVGCQGGSSRRCFVYDLSSGPSATVENAHYNPQNGLAIVTTADSFYLGNEGALVGQDMAQHNIFLAQYNYTSEALRTTGTTRYRVVDNDFIRQFYSWNSYIYYFVADREGQYASSECVTVPEERRVPSLKRSQWSVVALKGLKAEFVGLIWWNRLVARQGHWSW